MTREPRILNEEKTISSIKGTGKIGYSHITTCRDKNKTHIYAVYRRPTSDPETHRD